ncbi:alpha/beta hydrolase-fold protein [Marinilactibacillus sp. XAAS-LB27]|uniref:alpha/beta hydrolase n=1 Tax=Marinilactibacillus sp. XAAS-LB27 TaxID=3114538 RepID=UPI002E16DF92|nr:alpha/beta hydrolase-fold protein [Marinilactibacillus sp. XAAS-LB27]
MTTVDASFFSKNLERKVSYSAIIPKENRTARPFKTLYLLHGYSGDRRDWFYAGNIEHLAETYNIAVILPTGENSYYVNHPNGMKYGEYIGQELIEETRSLFPLSTNREETWIGGLSMGGYGALRNGLYYHETFGKIIALSSRIITKTVDKEDHMYPERIMDVVVGHSEIQAIPDEIDLYLLAHKKIDLPELYMACGTSDFLYEDNVAFHQELNRLQISHQYVEDEGDHNWTFWNQQIIPALNWLTE